MKKLIALSVACTIVATAGLASAEEPDFVKLTHQWWAYCRDKNFEAFEDMLAPGFLGANQRTTYDTKAYMESTHTVNISDFELTGFKTTVKPNIAVVTYYSKVAETIGGKRIESQRAPRVDVWVKTGAAWKIISHANLNPLGQ
jgi:hypothetical protein